MKDKALKQKGREFHAHRQFHRMFFKANDMDFAFQWLMGSAVHGGAGVGESYYAAARMKDGDPLSWEREFTALGDRVRARGEIALQAGHIVSVRNPLLRVAVCSCAVQGRDLSAEFCKKGQDSYRRLSRFSPHLRKEPHAKLCFAHSH